ncbi:MAG: DegT/DnrJ/EryC1/StrS family aminotransferase [Candidatus Omnitrophica bacterium]|nr:DegT/DnrJ/EryC1/StrS family aminotransferase [Candidatus Omnitrophota bacterium]
MKTSLLEPPAPIETKRDVPLFWPRVSENAIAAVSETLRTRWIGQGPKVEEVEQKFQTLTGAPYAVSVNSCTSALHLALTLAGVGQGDEVIATPLTCSATNIPILYCGAKAVFADIQENTLNIDPRSIVKKITKRTKAILIVDWAGLPCDMDEIRKIGKAHKLPVVEDAAHSIGGSYKGKPVGTLSDATCFSFQAIKQITSGDGGMLTVLRKDWAKRAKLLRWYGIDREFKGSIYKKFQMHEIGYKYHMNDIAAAILLHQLDELTGILARRRQVVERYRRGLQDVPGLTLADSPADRVSGNWLFTIKVARRDDFKAKLASRGVESDLVHIRCDVIPIFGGKRLPLPAMNTVEKKYICIPLNNQLSDDAVDHVIKTIRSGW